MKVLQLMQLFPAMTNIWVILGVLGFCHFTKNTAPREHTYAHTYGNTVPSVLIILVT